MKKITNNTMLGKLTIILNVVVLIFFIISMLLLMKFDKTNNVVVSERNNYEKAYEEYVMAQHPLKQDSAEVAYYQYKVDTLMQKTPASKDERKALAESIENNKQILAEKIKLRDEHLAKVEELTGSYTALKAHWDEINDANDKAKKSFVMMAILTLIAFIIKTIVLAHYGYKNSKNLHNVANWMKDGMAPYMSYVSWFVPVYNLLKPVSFIKEIWEETDYVLESKNLLANETDKVDNSGLNLGIWWGLFLISALLMNFVLYKTFFAEGAFFLKFNHGSIAIAAIVIMILCMLLETYLILTYNKKNKLMADNEDNF